MQNSTCPACGEDPSDASVSRYRQKSIRVSREGVGVNEVEKELNEYKSVLARLKSGESKESILLDFEGSALHASVESLLRRHPVKAIRDKYAHLNSCLMFVVAVVAGSRFLFNFSILQFEFDSSWTVLGYLLSTLFYLWTLYLLRNWNWRGYVLAGWTGGSAFVNDLRYREEILGVVSSYLLNAHMALGLGCLLLALTSLHLIFSRQRDVPADLIT